MISKFKGDERYRCRLSNMCSGIMSGFEELFEVFWYGGKACQAYSNLKAQK